MERLTRPLDNFPCRLAKGCTAEDWMEDVTGYTVFDWKTKKGENICTHCPFEKIINRLGFYEDLEEMMGDDLK